MHSQLIEIASWRVVAELVRRYPGQFVIIQTHPGDGQYNCLSVYERADPKAGGHLDLNRHGSANVHRPFRPGGEPQSWPLWERLLSPGDPKSLLDDLCLRAGLPPVTTLPRSSGETVAYRFIAAFLAHNAFGRRPWECRNLVHDSSGMGGSSVGSLDRRDRVPERGHTRPLRPLDRLSRCC